MEFSSANRLLLVAALVAGASAHGFTADPRYRGALYLPRIIKNAGLEHLVEEKDVGGNFGWADCPHCSNGGGVDVLQGFAPGGKWEMFEPLKGKFRKGVSVCGDKPGSDDHTAKGKYGAPASLPFVASYKPGGVANFQFDLNTPHGGYLEFYLCDVSKSGDISEGTFTGGSCYLLERVANAVCEAGTEKYRCGPIDPKYKSRWYLPCRESDKQFQNQIVGGEDGTMAYKIPDVPMEKAVVHSYWLTSNSCNPRGFREYFESGVWPAVKGCPGDGNTVGGFNGDHVGQCDTQKGKFPEEFFNCADVEVVGARGGGGKKKEAKAETTFAVLTSPVSTKAVATTVATDGGKSEENDAVETTTAAHAATSPASAAGTTVPIAVPKPVAPKPVSPQSEPDTPSAPKNTAASGAPKADFDLKPNCVPPFSQRRKNNRYYLRYYSRRQAACRAAKGANAAGGGSGSGSGRPASEATPKKNETERKPVSGHRFASAGGGEACVAMGDFCSGKKCCNGAQCSRVSGDGKVGLVCN